MMAALKACEPKDKR